MPDILIRNVSEAATTAIQAHAAAAGQSQQEYLKMILEAMTQEPIVKMNYGLKAIGPDAASAAIRRNRDGLVGQGATNMSQLQADAYKRAKLLVERNAPGDREAAIGLLRACFDDVFEVAG